MTKCLSKNSMFYCTVCFAVTKWHRSLTELPAGTQLCPQHLLAHPLSKGFTDRTKTKVCASKMWRFDCSWSYLYNSVIFSLCSKLEEGRQTSWENGTWWRDAIHFRILASSLVSGISRCLKDKGKYMSNTVKEYLYTQKIWYDIILH